MVVITKTETTDIVTQPKIDEIAQPSFARWFKHFLYMPATKRYFSKQDQCAIAQAVKQAEQGHVGEIQVVIEGHIPCSQAYNQNTLMRARQLFAEVGVWDTEYNSGILLYLNLCEQAVEIVIDRGIKDATDQAVWNEICQIIVDLLAQRQYREAVIQGVAEIGLILNAYYDLTEEPVGNELSNRPIILN